jgi:hypothetical protein
VKLQRHNGLELSSPAANLVGTRDLRVGRCRDQQADQFGDPVIVGR